MELKGVRFYDFYSHASCEARHTRQSQAFNAADFYSHASCEARQTSCSFFCLDQRISTHTPLARRDPDFLNSLLSGTSFLLTRLLRGATEKNDDVAKRNFISTHTPLARRDPTASRAIMQNLKFLLTRLLRGATDRPVCRRTDERHFYSHASCEARQPWHPDNGTNW